MNRSRRYGLVFVVVAVAALLEDEYASIQTHYHLNIGTSRQMSWN